MMIFQVIMCNLLGKPEFHTTCCFIMPLPNQLMGMKKSFHLQPLHLPQVLRLCLHRFLAFPLHELIKYPLCRCLTPSGWEKESDLSTVSLRKLSRESEWVVRVQERWTPSHRLRNIHCSSARSFLLKLLFGDNLGYVLSLASAILNMHMHTTSSDLHDLQRPKTQGYPSQKNNVPFTNLLPWNDYSHKYEVPLLEAILSKRFLSRVSTWHLAMEVMEAKAPAASRSLEAPVIDPRGSWFYLKSCDQRCSFWNGDVQILRNKSWNI